MNHFQISVAAILRQKKLNQWNEYHAAYCSNYSPQNTTVYENDAIVYVINCDIGSLYHITWFLKK